MEYDALIDQLGMSVKDGEKVVSFSKTNFFFQGEQSPEFEGEIAGCERRP